MAPFRGSSEWSTIKAAPKLGLHCSDVTPGAMGVLVRFFRPSFLSSMIFLHAAMNVRPTSITISHRLPGSFDILYFIDEIKALSRVRTFFHSIRHPTVVIYINISWNFKSTIQADIPGESHNIFVDLTQKMWIFIVYIYPGGYYIVHSFTEISKALVEGTRGHSFQVIKR